MNIFRKSILPLCIILFTAVAFASIPPDVSGKLDKAFGELSRLQWQESQQAVAAIETIVRSADDETQGDVEERAIALLESDAPFSSKQYVMRVLAVIGTENCIDTVSGYLTDEKLSHMARFVLVGAGGSKAEQELIDALNETNGTVKAGVINSLGSMRSKKAVDELLPLLYSGDKEIAAASLMALADIAAPKAQRAVENVYNKDVGNFDKQTAADAYLRLAMTIEGQNKSDAEKLYANLFENAQEEYLRIAGFTGLLRVTQGQGDIEDLVQSGLSHSNQRIRKMAGVYLMETAQPEVFEQFARKINSYTPQAKVALIDAFKARNYRKGRELLLGNLDSSDQQVKAASISALTELGSVGDIPRITDLLSSSDRDIQKAAVICLKSYKASGADEALITQLKKAQTALKIELIEILNFREAKGSLAVIQDYIDSPDRKLSRAALEIFADLGSASDLPVLIDSLNGADGFRERRYRTSAISKICLKEPENSGQFIINAYRSAESELKPEYLKLLSVTGYDRKLEVIRQAAQAGSKDLRDTAVRLLANWDGPEVMDDLLEMIKTSDNDTYRILALRGYINLLRQKPMSAESKYNKLVEINNLADSSDKKKLVISAMAEVQSPAALEFVEKALDDPQLKTEASLAAVDLAEKLATDNFEKSSAVLEKVVKIDAAESITQRAAESLDKLKKYKGRLLAEWSFTNNPDGWNADNHCSIAVENGALRVNIEGEDPFISAPLDVPGGELEVQMKVKAPGPTTTWQYFWGSNKKPLAQAPLWISSFEVPASSTDWQTIKTVINVDGNLTQFRIDPGSGQEAVYIDSIRFLMNKPQQVAAGPMFNPDAEVRILLIGTPLDHPFGTHMYMHECGILEKCLDQLPGVDAVVSLGWPSDKSLLEDLDAIALYSSPGAEILLKNAQPEEFKRLMKEGVGLASLHWSTGIGDANNKELENEYINYLGGIFSFAFSGLDMAQAKVVQLEPGHAISNGWNDFEQLDEIYLDIKLLDEAKPLVEVRFKDRTQVVAWTYERSDGGRSYGNTLGHFHENFWIPEFRRSYVNGILWAAGYDIPDNGAVCFIVPEDMKLEMP